MAERDEYFNDKVAEAQPRIPTLEHMLGKGLMQPFCNTNSGSRKLMHATQRDQIIMLLQGEKAILETGYEIRFGDLSSTVTATDSDYIVTNKISKFSHYPNQIYYLILKDIRNKKVDVIKRTPYEYITEQYGYLYNNIYMDNVTQGAYIPKDTIIQKSLAFDEYMNRTDGRNMNVAYMSLDQNMEDSMIISDEAAKKYTSPLIKPVSIMINENNIPLNIYGTEDMYKCIPDIGEEVKDGTLIALRKEKREEMVYSESVERLREVSMSDEKKLLSGTVVDIDIYCNNPQNLDAYHNAQFKMYYNEQMRMAQEVVAAVTPFAMEGYEISYELQMLYAESKRILNHCQYIDKKPFSNIILKVTVLEELPLKEGVA